MIDMVVFVRQKDGSFNRLDYSNRIDPQKVADMKWMLEKYGHKHILELLTSSGLSYTFGCKRCTFEILISKFQFWGDRSWWRDYFWGRNYIHHYDTQT